MNIDITYKFFKKLEEDNFSFIYQGEFSDDIMVEILRLNDYNMDYITDIGKLKKRISFLMAECFQNITRHGDKPEIINTTNNKPSMFLTRNIGNMYYIGSSNLIDNTKIDSLKLKLNNINNLNQEELKSLHFDILSNHELSEKGWAGLGLIEMARKSGQKLAYSFEFVNYYLSQFYVQLKLKGAEDDLVKSDMSIHDTIEIHNMMIANHILMIHRGDFSQESILPFLGMLENNLNKQSETLTIQKKVFYLVVELLQNISKYAKESAGRREGIVLIGRRGRQYTINTGNFIENDKIDTIKSKLDSIISLDKESLNELHKKKLIESASGSKVGSGLGLIDVARFTSEMVNYDFQTINEGLSFYTISIAV